MCVGKGARVLKALRPHGLDGLRLTTKLRDLLDFWQGRCATVAVEAQLPASPPPVSSQAALSIYRTCGGRSPPCIATAPRGGCSTAGTGRRRWSCSWRMTVGRIQAL